MSTSTNAGLTFDDIRELIVRELRAEGLSKVEQDTLMQQVSEALMERATFALMKSAPPELLLELGQEGKDPHNPEDAAFFMQRIMQSVPNAQGIVVDAIKAGLFDYQQYLDGELAKRN
jgi:hypothetical protein